VALVIDAARANEVISRFSADLTATTNRERRVAMSSPLYDLQGRSSLGFLVSHDIGAELVRRTEASLPAEQVGERMGELLTRPYFLALFILFEGYLMGREMRLIEFGAPSGEDAVRDAEDTIVLTDWFERVCSTYRTDDKLFPGAEVFDQPIVPAERIVELAGEPLDEEMAARAQRAIGTLELYALTVHGEQRDGNFDHGPYPAPDGGVLVVHEINDLDNDFLPWVEGPQRLGVDAVGVIRRFGPEVEITCDMFGTSSVAPSGSPFEQLALLVREGETVRALAVEELEEIAARAGAATGELFGRIAGWDEEFRTTYGRPLWLNHFAPIMRIAGAADQLDWLREAGAKAGPDDLAFLKGPAVGQVWARLAAGEEMFTPVADVAVSR
jgi:hypothetical protein